MLFKKTILLLHNASRPVSNGNCEELRDTEESSEGCLDSTRSVAAFYLGGRTVRVNIRRAALALKDRFREKVKSVVVGVGENGIDSSSVSRATVLFVVTVVVS